MAFIIPSDISKLALSGAHMHELDTLSYLKSNLSDDYTVFHGVHWTREYESTSQFGEIDFVVMNQAGELLFIEQKNGSLDETVSGLVKRYSNSEKNVIDQIHRSVDKVREKFRWQNANGAGLNINIMIYCPDYEVKKLNAVGIDKSRVVDAASKHKLAQRISTVLKPCAHNREWKDKVFNFFCDTFEVVPSIHQHVSAQNKSYFRQTGALASILSNLSMTPYRLRINGVAGSGKSHIARQFMARETAKNHKVLMLCFNRPLAERLKKQVPENAYVNTWHGFCAEFLKSRGEVLDYKEMNTSPTFWSDLQEKVTEAQIPEEWIFDTLIIDEGQDFENEWAEIIRLFVKDDADILWLEDLDQNIYEKKKVVLDGFVSYQCAVNYRTPESIARFTRNMLPFDFEFGNSLPGLGVGVHEYSTDTEQKKVVTSVLQKLTKNYGFSYDDIVVISCRGANSSIFSKMDKIGGVKIRKFTGDYDDNGNQTLTEGELVFDSIYRFKGKESPAVILVDVEADSEKLEKWQRLIYCGITRASIRLDVVFNKEIKANKPFLKYKE